MLPKMYSYIDNNSDVSVRRFRNSHDVSMYGAFPIGDVIDFEISISRRLGAMGVVMRICRDGESDVDIPLSLSGSDGAIDVYTCSINTLDICQGNECGLFYYTFLMLRGEHTLFTQTPNNVDALLAESDKDRFRLLVYEKNFTTPRSFGKGVLYQIFPDRFCRGDKDIPVKDGSVLNHDWDNGIPQYPAVRGERYKNNVFFGGDLWGIADKLDYIASLGVTYIYLCPVFKAYSNHRYDTGDYTRIDDMLGGDAAFDNLVSKAKEKGIGIILDGVFNHTGDDSLYFNRYKRYGEGGAYNSSSDRYAGWYNFKSYPDEYECWWGIPILPRLDHSNEDCRRYFTGENGIVEKYIRRGIAGWRLDVADELSDEFLDELRTSAKNSSNGEAVIIGEVWENAADKISYGKRRRYLSGRQLDSVMNYPLKNAILSFCLWGDAETLYNTLTEIYSSYPRPVSDKLMNLLGTHDTDRILTVLGRDMGDEDEPNCVLAHKRLSAEQVERGVKLLKIASALQYTVYGIPSLYYGDEVALEGYGDPFCRMPFPWNDLDSPTRCEVLEHYRRLGKIREEKAFDEGEFYVLKHTESALVFVREKDDCRIVVAVNRGDDVEFEVPRGEIYVDLISGKRYSGRISIEKDSAMVLKAVAI